MVSHLLRAPTEGLHWTHLLDTRLGKVLYLLDVVYENEDLQAGVLGDGIYFALQHSDPGGKGHLAYYMRILHVVSSSGSIFQLPPRRGWHVPFIITLTMPRLSSWKATDGGLRGLGNLLIEVADSYTQLTILPFVLIITCRSVCWFTVSVCITLRIDRGK